MLPLFYVVFLFAAGSNASPCKVSSKAPSASGSPPPSTAGAATLGGTTPGSSSNKVALQLPGQNNVLPLNSSASSSLPGSTTSQTSGGSCPPGFMNTVFNTGAGKNGGWPETTWSSLTSNGISQWIGFSVDTLDKKDSYGNCKTTPSLNNAQVHMVMDPRDVDAGVAMVQGGSAPKYLGLFNEPDFSFEGFTPLTDPIPAAQSLAKFFSIPHPGTTYISPGLMNANGDWLKTFRDNCNNCFDQIPIISMHVYNPTPQGVLDQITTLHATWPDKKIWITELSPATPECSMDGGAMTSYINELIPKIIALKYVERVFWNSGEWDAASINNAPAPCNPALTDASGNGTPVLQALNKVCGGGGTATS